MSKSLILDMDYHVTKFLIKHGGLPAVLKETDERIHEAEIRLTNRLRRLQTGLESRFIQALRERGYLFGSETEQLSFIYRIFQDSFEEMATVIAEDSVQASEIGRQLTFADLIAQGMNLTLTTFSESIRNTLRDRHYTFSEDTFNRIVGDFASTLTTAYEDGLGIDDTARLLRADFKDLRDNRLQLIARTEVQGAQNEGINETMNEFNVEYKQWLTVGDSRVRGRNPSDRYDHISLHGEVVRRDEKFSNGLMHPLDRSGPIGDWINCRCRMRPYIPKLDEHIISTPYYPSAA